MAEKLRYSQRKRLAETGSLGDYSYADASPELRNALRHLIYEPSDYARRLMIDAASSEARLHFGWSEKQTIKQFLGSAAADEILDLLEIVIEACGAAYRVEHGAYLPPTRERVMPDAEARINALCERHRFGYCFEEGKARTIGSPALDVEVVGPTLLAVQRPGWDQVERSFREALDHQRGGETDDALTAAHAAVEAALKAVGMTGQFKAMLKQFRNSGLVPPYLQEVPEALDALLTLLDRSNAIRSSAGDAHGKASGTGEVPKALADLGIHWAGAFILFVSESSSD